MNSIQSLCRSIFAVGLLLCSYAGVVNGQDDTVKTELGLRQRLIQMKMVEVEKRFRTIADNLQAEKPEQAKLLTEAYQRSKEGLITSKMAEATTLLNQNRLDEARKIHLEVRDGLDELVRLLTQRKEPTVSKQQEIQQLEQFKNEIEKQLQQQQRQTSETYKASNKEKTIEELEAKIKSLDELAKKQQELMEATRNSEKPSLRELDAIADRQFEIRKQTERLKNELQGMGGEDSESKPSDADGDLAAGEQKPSDGNGDEHAGEKPGQKPSGEPKPGGKSEDKPKNKPENKQPNGDKPGDKKPNGDKPNDDQPKTEKPEDKPGDGAKPAGGGQKPPGDSKDQPGKPGQSGQKGKQGQPQPGQQALDQAQKEQAKAEEKLGSAKPEDAAKNQEEAIKKINEAKTEIEQEKRRIESLPKEALEKLAEDQRRLRDKAMEVVAEMKKAKKSADEGQENPQDQQNPGEQAMKEAGDAQKQAADAMKDEDSQQAQESQKKAQQKMRKAVEEIEERLAQLKDETREEKLARLESRFKEMLERQRTTSAMTMEIQDRRSVLEGLQHRDQLVLLRLANNEAEINESAQQAYDLLLEDGTSVVFPEVVADLQLELTNASELLTDEKTGSYTQLVQKEIEATIEDLVDALKKAKDDAKKDDSAGGGGGGEQPEPPLLKKSAELKVLRMQQLRLNRRTKNIEKLKGQPGVDEEVVSKEIESAAQLQQKLVEMTDQIID